MSRRRTHLTGLALGVAVLTALLVASVGTSAGASTAGRYRVTHFKVEVKGVQKTTQTFHHKPENACDISDNSSVTEKVVFRSAPLPESVRKAALPVSDAVYNPVRLGKAMGELLTLPAQVSISHLPQSRVSVAERLSHVRALLRRGSFSFDEAVTRADRVTVAVTIFALLELYKQGELVWDQAECFGEITVRARERIAPPLRVSA